MADTLPDMLVHYQRLMRVADRPPAPHAHTASSRPEGRHVVQMACGQPMCLQHDACSCMSMLGMCLTASGHCLAAWKQPTCSRPRPHAPQPLQIEACDTCIAAPRHAPWPAAPRRCTTCFSTPYIPIGHARALPGAQWHLRSASCTAHAYTATQHPRGPRADTWSR